MHALMGVDNYLSLLHSILGCIWCLIYTGWYSHSHDVSKRNLLYWYIFAIASCKVWPMKLISISSLHYYSLLADI